MERRACFLFAYIAGITVQDSAQVVEDPFRVGLSATPVRECPPNISKADQASGEAIAFVKYFAWD